MSTTTAPAVVPAGTSSRIYLAGASGTVVHVTPGDPSDSCAGMTLGSAYAAAPRRVWWRGLNGEEYGIMTAADAAYLREITGGPLCNCEMEGHVWAPVEDDEDEDEGRLSCGCSPVVSVWHGDDCEDGLGGKRFE